MKTKIINAVAVAALICAAAYAQEVKKLEGKSGAEWAVVAQNVELPAVDRIKAYRLWKRLSEGNTNAKLREHAAILKNIPGKEQRHVYVECRLARLLGKEGKQAEFVALISPLTANVEKHGCLTGYPRHLALRMLGWQKDWKKPELKNMAIRLAKATTGANSRNFPGRGIVKLSRNAALSAAEQLDILNTWKPLFLTQVENYGFVVGRVKVLSEMKKRGVITQAEERATVRKYSNYLASETVGKNKEKAKAAFAEIAVMIEAWSVVDKYIPEVKK